MKERCQNVWLAVAGLVINKKGEWLVVKKRYGGLKGVWSLPAGFVNADETVDEAVLREVEEETGIQTEVIGLIGVRSGVLSVGCSDNMLIFLLKPLNEEVVPQLDELYEAVYMSPQVIVKDRNRSLMLEELLGFNADKAKKLIDGLNPGDPFGYLSYKLFI